MFFSLIHVTSLRDEFPCHFPNPASFLAVCPAKPDLAPDRPMAGQTVSADPPNWYSKCQFGASPEWPGGPPDRPAYGPVPRDLPPKWPAYINLVGRPSHQFFPLLLLPTPPPSPWPPPPQASPPPSLSTQPILSKLRSGVDRVVLKLSTEDLRVSSTALGDQDLSSSSCAPCLRVNPFYLLLPLALASHSVCSCYGMSRSRVYLGLDPICLGIDCLGFCPLMA
jgi:hypothetical protein